MTRPRLPTALFTVMNGNLPRPSLLPSGMTLTSSSSSQSSSIVLPINRRMIDLNRHFDRLRRRIAFFFCGSLDVVADAAPLVWLTGVGRGRSVGLTVWHCTLARPADPPPPPRRPRLPTPLTTCKFSVRTEQRFAAAATARPFLPREGRQFITCSSVAASNREDCTG